MSTHRAQCPRVLAALMLLIAAARATAQCPNGRPPPCQSGTPAARRVAAVPSLPALNSRTWIVVPFSNVTKAADIDWLRDASVNLLSMDMGRWTDVGVVPDKRVADLVRELPAARRNESLSLNDGLGIARRAGAGMLVMGDVYKLGAATRIVANVFDARNGARVRSFTEEVSSPDSLLRAFGPVARAVLAVPPPADTKTGDVGTQSLEAYQAYLLGTKALFRYNLPEARAHLERALAIDSTFALAHLQYSVLLAWGEAQGGTNEVRKHALAAQRLGTSLNNRDRMLIDAQIANADNDYRRMCSISETLVARDSTDVQALNMLGECAYHDNAVQLSPGDSTVGHFQTSWNTAIRALTRVLALDPSFLGSFQHVFDILRSTNRAGLTCPRAGAPPPSCVQWQSVVMRSGDTLVTQPVRLGINGNAAYFAQQDRARKERARLANLEAAQSIAQRWVDADPTSEGAHFAMADVYLSRGNLGAANAELRHVSSRATQENAVTLRMKMEIAAKTGHGAEARAMFDSIVKAIPDNPIIDPVRGSMELMFGRMKRYERGALAAAAKLGPEAVAYEHYVALAALGIQQPGVERAESVFVASMHDASCSLLCRYQKVMPTLAFSLHTPTIPRTFLDSAEDLDGRLTPIKGLAAHDSAMVRAGAVSQETSARENIAQSQTEYGWSVIGADAFLKLRDSTNALRLIRFYVDTAMAFTPVLTGNPGIVSMGNAVLWPRAMLLRADLANAMGYKAEARTWYLRVLDLWADADDELKPTIERIRAALVALDTKA